jgi:hypothetical protein
MTPSQQADLVLHRAHAIAAAREALRVAVQRSRDRRRLADNARAARQEAFAVTLGEAADAHEANARAIAARLDVLERGEGPTAGERGGGAAVSR